MSARRNRQMGKVFWKIQRTVSFCDIREQRAQKEKTEPACSSVFPQEVLDLINKCNKIPKLHAKHLY
jgi:hypothetical protein